MQDIKKTIEKKIFGRGLIYLNLICFILPFVKVRDDFLDIRDSLSLFNIIAVSRYAPYAWGLLALALLGLAATHLNLLSALKRPALCVTSIGNIILCLNFASKVFGTNTYLEESIKGGIGFYLIVNISIVILLVALFPLIEKFILKGENKAGVKTEQNEPALKEETAQN
jgi:uncharacterized membrane protein